MHETIPDWMDKPIEELAGKRAIAITVGGTTIDGELEYRMEKTEDGLRVESLNFVNYPNMWWFASTVEAIIWRTRFSSR